MVSQLRYGVSADIADDPLLELADSDDDIVPIVDKKVVPVKRKRYNKNKTLHTVVKLDMPVNCPEEDSDCINVRTNQQAECRHETDGCS